MTAAGDQVLDYAYQWLGTTESPPNSNLCSPFTDEWGAGAWCAMYVSYCNSGAGYPLPAINGPAGFSYCPDGQIYGYTYDGANTEPEPGDTLIFSWEPFYVDGIAYCSSGIYAGAPAGDHTGYFVGWLGDGYMRTLEGNTSQSSWDDGGAVQERTDRYSGQICCFWRPAALQGSALPEEEEMTDEDFARIQSIVHDEVVNIWRAQEMANLDTDRAQQGAHAAGVGLMRSEEYSQTVEAACKRALDSA